MKKLIFTLTMIASVSSFAATKAQVASALQVSNLTNIENISETANQPRCFGCRVLKISGQGVYGDAYEIIEVDQNGPDSYSAKIIGVSR